MIPEDPVSFCGKVYEGEFAKCHVGELMTKVLSRREREKRHVPLNPSNIIYTKSGDGSAVTDNTEMENIINDIIFDVNSSWETNLKKEVEWALSSPTTSV